MRLKRAMYLLLSGSNPEGRRDDDWAKGGTGEAVELCWGFSSRCIQAAGDLRDQKAKLQSGRQE